ncbi:MAG: CvpA family protein [Candidatus Rariloculaceae bacterium]|tara:strand:+ start:2798 stop:3286 length:489 start_codon:yes stop_codon:yes gene_type:complete
MSWVDVVIILGCLASAGLGVWRGFMKEMLSLITWLAAIWLAWRFAWVIEPVLSQWVAAPELTLWLARSAIFVMILAVGGILSWFIRKLLLHPVLSGTDRLLGAIFGLGRGVIVVGLAVILLRFLGLEEDSRWQEARLNLYGDRIAESILYYAEFGSRYAQQQ